MASRAHARPPSPPEPRVEVLGIERPRADIPRVELASSGPLPALGDLPAPAAASRNALDGPDEGAHFSPGATAEGMFWLDGSVVMCACPACGAPMTVRLWLMIADCWQCETTIELTLQQEREARRLLARSEQRHDDVRPSVPVAAAPLVSRHATASRGSVVRAKASVSAPHDTRQPRVSHEPAAPPRMRPLPRRSRPVNRRKQVRDWLGALLKNMPAWLVSLIFHVILLTILGLMSDREEGGPFITLSARVNRIVREGGDVRIVEPTDEAVFDLGIPDAVDMEDPAMRRALARADQDARQLRLTDPDNPYLPDLTKIKQRVESTSTSRRALAVRDPRIRIEMVRREGGTTLTEAAVARGLRWLSRHQNSDGSWSLSRFHRAGSCACGNRGRLNSDSAGTSLALLPFLGAGQTHLSGIYKDEVSKALRWMIQNQESNGDLRGSSAQYPGMYAQGQGAIVLCEAFLMTGDEALRVPAQKAIDFIVESQYADGGWRYYPNAKTRNRRGDTSVLGWQLMALQSALAADLAVPTATLENAGHFLDSVQHDDGAQYAYLPRERASAPMTAEGLLCRIYLGWKRNHPALVSGVNWMLKSHPPSVDEPNIYYWYYATQTMHHYGGPKWHRWNIRMRDVLVATQETRGHEAGSWAPDGPLSSQGGRIYMTSLAICCLEVYYRHLPIFRQIDLE